MENNEIKWMKKVQKTKNKRKTLIKAEEKKEKLKKTQICHNNGVKQTVH